MPRSFQSLSSMPAPTTLQVYISFNVGVMVSEELFILGAPYIDLPRGVLMKVPLVMHSEWDVKINLPMSY